MPQGEGTYGHKMGRPKEMPDKMAMKRHVMKMRAKKKRA